MPPEKPRDVWPEFVRTALVWFVPALLVLPFYLLAVAVSVAAADGALLEASDSVRGRIFAALGPLLVLCGGVVAVLTIRFADDAEAYLGMGVASLVCVGFGIVMVRRELRRLRRPSENEAAR